MTLLRGWSFGFIERAAKEEDTDYTDSGLKRRFVEDMDLKEVSIIDNRKIPCYASTSIEMRADGNAGHETVNVQNLGDVTILGKRGLSSIELESFFPNKDYSFAAYKKKQSPWEYVKKILSWQEKTLRLVVTKTKINMQVVISSFSYGEEDGTGDIKYKLSLMEYWAPKYTKPKKKKTSKTAASTTKKNIKQGTKRETSKTKAKVHVVSGNDTLWSISKKYYGTGSYANKIYEANKTIIERTAVKHGFRSSANKGVNGWWIFDGERLVIP